MGDQPAMNDQVYVVTGAGGNIGKYLSQILLRNGHKVRVIGRSISRLQPLIDQGAQATFGSLDDPEFLTEAFEGAKSVFAMIPSNLEAENYRKYQGQISDALIEGIKRSEVRNVVALSSLGAHLPEGTGPIKGLFDFEQKLEKLVDVNVLILRPAFFMENLFQGIPVMQNTGMNGLALRPDVSTPMIATRDIAEFAAKSMVELSFKGVTAQVLLGPSNVSMAEATLSIGKVIGNQELKYVQIPYERLKVALSGMGATEDVVSEFIEMTEWYNKGSMANLVRTETSTTKTTIDDFAFLNSELFKGNGARAAGNI